MRTVPMVLWILAGSYLVTASAGVTFTAVNYSSAHAWAVAAIFALLAVALLVVSYRQLREDAFMAVIELGSFRGVKVTDTYTAAVEETRIADIPGASYGLGDTGVTFYLPGVYETKYLPTSAVLVHVDAVAQLTKKGEESEPTLVMVDPTLLITLSPSLAKFVTVIGLGDRSDLAAEHDITYIGVSNTAAAEETRYRSYWLADRLAEKLKEPLHDAIRTVIGNTTFEDVVLNSDELKKAVLLELSRQPLVQQAGLLKVDTADDAPTAVIGECVRSFDFRIEKLAFSEELQTALQAPRIAELNREATKLEGTALMQFIDQAKTSGVQASEAIGSYTLSRLDGSNITIVSSQGGLVGGAVAELLGKKSTSSDS